MADFQEVNLQSIKEEVEEAKPITDSFSIEDMKKAAAYYEKKRLSGRKFYRENKEKCLNYTRLRREKVREMRKKEAEERTLNGEASPVRTKGGRKTSSEREKSREYARKRYTEQECKERTAARQKAYRIRRKNAYLALMAQEKTDVSDKLPETVDDVETN